MKLLIPAVMFCILQTSCETSTFIQHTPTLANTGMHTGKGEFTGNLYYSTGSSSSNSYENGSGASPYQSVNGIQAQGSFSLFPSFALQAAYMSSDEKGGSKENGNKTIVYTYKRNITETGLAYFHAISKDKSFFMELGAGMGFGKYDAKENNSTLAPGGRYYNHDVTKFYFQPSFYFLSTNIHLSSGLKFSAISFKNITTDYTLQERESRLLPKYNSYNSATLDFFFKAEFFLNNLPQVGITTQALFSGELGNSYSGYLNDNNYGIGLRFRLGKPGNSDKK